MKQPAFQFYPADWRKDPGIQSLSLNDRGAWFEMLCLMHESPRRGVLLLPSGEPMTEQQLARILGISADKMSAILLRIHVSGVSSRDEISGAILCRRMVRDEEQANQRKIDGHLGGNPSLTDKYNSPGFVYAVLRPSDGAIKIGIAINVQGRLYKLRHKANEELELLAALPVSDMGATEASLHKKYSQYRLVGEWFNLPDTLKGELISTLKGERKDKVRASSSSSSSPSSNTVTNSSILVSPSAEKRDGRQDVAAELFRPAYLRYVHNPYAWLAGDFPQLARLRKRLHLKSDETPVDWESGLDNYFASPLSDFTLKHFAAKFDTFKNSPLDRFNTPVNHVNGGKYGHKTKTDRNLDAAHRLRARLDPQDRGSGDSGTERSVIGGVFRTNPKTKPD